MSLPIPLPVPRTSANPTAEALALRQVHRAMSELRRGTPVRLEGKGFALVLAAAETVGAAGLAELAAQAAAAPVLLLAPVRAAAALQRPMPLSAPEMGAVALRLPPALLDPARLRALADPTEELLALPAAADIVAAPALSLAALNLAKLGRLLPALVAAPALPAHGLAQGASHGALLSVRAEDVLAYPESAATSLVRVAEARVPLEVSDDTRIVAFRAADGGIEHLAMLVGEPEKVEAPLTRLHSECFTGDLLGSLRCDCGPQLQVALQRMAAEGAGVLVYLAQEGRGIGLVNKLRAYALQDTGLDTLDANRALGYGADERNFLVAATILRSLGIGRVRLLTNNPDKLAGLTACGVEVAGRASLRFAGNGVNNRYLRTKAERFGHDLPVE